MSKREWFLSASNRSLLAKKFYTAHERAGGQVTYPQMYEQVSQLMLGWRKLNILDTYECIVDDAESEREQINAEFFRRYEAEVVPTDARRPRQSLDTVDAYRTFDCARPEPRTMNFDARVPYYQKVHPRWYATDNDALTGRSLEPTARHRGDMSEVWSTVDRPYAAPDAGDLPWYGQELDDASDILTATH